MRKILAVIVTKLLIFAGKLAGKKGSSSPGAIALKICPDLISRLSAGVKKDIIAVCGTNGKTTSNNLLYSLIQSAGNRVVCNNVGANMLEGVATAFAASANIFGRINADYACIEIDEFSAVKVFRQLKPKYMVITNLFRDQLDRYGEIDITINALKKAVDMLGDVTLILNGDDPLVAAFGKTCGKKCLYFGISENAGIALNEIKEGRFCRFCGEELKYNFYHYSQLGDYYCPKCGFCRPHIDYEAVNVKLEHGLSFDLNGMPIDVNYRGFYNIYNILAAYAVFDMLKLDTSHFNDVLDKYKPQIGRMETFNIGIETVFNLSKNPAGFNQAISSVLSDKRKKNVVVVINDNAQDGRDISWIWDVDFERLKDAGICRLVSSGIRHNDVAVRFKYALLENTFDIADVKSAIESCIDSDAEVLYVLVNYTALFSTQNILRGLSK